MKIDWSVATLEAPDGWTDQSIYKLVSPRDEGLDAPLASGRSAQVAATRASIAVSRLATQGHSIDTIIDSQVQHFERAMPAFRRESGAPWQHPRFGQCPAFEMSYEAAPGARVHQAFVYLSTAPGESAVCVTFTASTQAFARRRGEFAGVLASLEIPQSKQGESS